MKLNEVKCYIKECDYIKHCKGLCYRHYWDFLRKNNKIKSRLLKCKK